MHIHGGDEAIGGEGHVLTWQGPAGGRTAGYNWYLGRVAHVFEEEGEGVKGGPGKAGEIIHGKYSRLRPEREDPSATMQVRG